MNRLNEFGNNIGQRVEYGAKAVRRTIGTHLAPVTLAAMAAVGGVAVFVAEHIAHGQTPSKISCTGIFPEWKENGVPKAPAGAVPYEFNPTNENNRVEVLFNGYEKIFDNRNGNKLVDLVLPPNQLAITEVFGNGATTGAELWGGGGSWEGYRTAENGNYSDLEKTLLRGQMYRNALDGNPQISGFFVVSGTISLNNFSSEFLTREQLEQRTLELKAKAEKLCEPPKYVVMVPVANSGVGLQSEKPAPEPDLRPVVKKDLPTQLGDLEYFGRRSTTRAEKIIEVIDRFQIRQIIAKKVRVNGVELSDRFSDGTGVFTFYTNPGATLEIVTSEGVFTDIVSERSGSVENLEQQLRDAELAGQVEVSNLFKNPGTCGLPNGCGTVTHEAYTVDGSGKLQGFTRVAYRNPNR